MKISTENNNFTSIIKNNDIKHDYESSWDDNKVK
jgi:hypothetical protein